MFETVEAKLKHLLGSGDLVSGSFTSPRSGGGEHARVDIRPSRVRSKPVYHFAYRAGGKATHRNLALSEALLESSRLLKDEFTQCDLRAREEQIRIRIAGDGQARIRVSRSPAAQPSCEHDRTKRRIVAEGAPVEYLVHLGVMQRDGRVIAAKYDKFKQINRYLEIVADSVGNLKPDGKLRIIDFGSGKSYLTFALYHYFHRMLGRDVNIVGLDVKKDVVEHCSAISRELGCEGLTFQVSDIAGFDCAESVDMVVSLHACDTATDDALAKAAQWKADVILAVPCCQHELARQIESAVNRPLLKHGILKERLAALVTDALRAEWLESMGYRVQVMEFIETAHTPKNLLIRAVRKKTAGHTSARLAAEYAEFRDFWNAAPSIERACYRSADVRLDSSVEDRARKLPLP